MFDFLFKHIVYIFSSHLKMGRKYNLLLDYTIDVQHELLDEEKSAPYLICHDGLRHLLHSQVIAYLQFN